jgi:hypothetical protein
MSSTNELHHTPVTHVIRTQRISCKKFGLRRGGGHLLLALEFARTLLPGDFDEIRYIFSKRKAYSKFRALLM